MTITQPTPHQITLQEGVHQFNLLYTLTYDGKRKTPDAIVVENDKMAQITFNDVGSITDTFTRDASGLITVMRQWHLLAPGNYRLQFTVDYLFDSSDTALFIPAIWYQENRKGKGVFPSAQIAKTWSFLETRMSIPSCAQISAARHHYHCATEAAEEERFLSSLTADRNGAIISIPGSEWPFSYRGKKSLIDTQEEALPSISVSKAGLAYQRVFYLYAQESPNHLQAYSSFLQALPEASEETQTSYPSWQLWIEYKLTRLLNLVRASDDGLAYLIMGEGNATVQSVYEFTAASFLVKSLQGAYILATMSEFESENPHLLQARKRVSELLHIPDDRHLLTTVAKRIGDFFLQAERHEGVFLDNYDLNKDIWGGYLGISEHPEYKTMANSRCNGEAMKHYVLLYTTLKQYGIVVPSYLALAKRVANFYCESQLSNGSFGRWWTSNGKPRDIQGTNGAYIGSFFCTLLPLLDDADPLKRCLQSALYRAYGYYSELAYEGAFYGDTLDADSCDKEAGVALISFFLDLYELEADPRYLESAQLAADFIVQWIWQRDAFFPPDSPLGKVNFQSKGMTSVSVAHHHLDFYGMAIAFEFLRLDAYVPSPFLQKQASLMIQACRQLLNTPSEGYGRGIEFIGWQAEQLNHTAWEYFNRPELMNGHYDIDIAWVTVLTLGSLLLIQERFSSILQ